MTDSNQLFIIFDVNAQSVGMVSFLEQTGANVAKIPISDVKSFFKIGDRPTESNFEDLIDSVWSDLNFEIPPGDNLFDTSSGENELGKFVSYTTGSIGTNADYNASGFIGVKPNTSYGISNVTHVAWYTSGKVFISGAKSSVDENANGTVLVSLSNAAYIRFSVQPDYWANLMMTEALNVIPFKTYTGEKKVASKDVQNFTELEDATENLEIDVDLINSAISGVIEPSKNLFDKTSTDIVQDRFVNSINGQLGGNATYNSTPFFNVSGGSDYYMSNVNKWAWYGESKAFISGGNGDSFSEQLLAPANAEFLRMSYYKNQENILMISQSSIALPYESFGGKINDLELNETLEGIFKAIAQIGNMSTWVTPTNVLYIGDSFWNDGTDVAARTIIESGISGNYSLSVAGTTLPSIPSVLNAFDRSAFDTVVIGRVTNDIAGGASFETARQRMMEIILLFTEVQLIVSNCPPLNNHAGYNSGTQSVIDDFNLWLASLWTNDSSRRVFDINSVLDADGDNNIDDAYDRGGTNIHPQNVGYDACGVALAALLLP